MTACEANSLEGEKVSWSSSSSSWASSVASAISVSSQAWGRRPSGRRPHFVPLCDLLPDKRLLGAQPGLRADVQLVVCALRPALARQHGAEPAADEAERDRDDARVRQLP